MAILLRVLVVLCLFGSGCGDDGGGGVSTGLPSGKRLSELDGDEIVRACEKFVETLDAEVEGKVDEFNCTLQALPMSISVTLSGKVTADVGMCNDLVDRCLGGEAIGNMPPASMRAGSQIDCDAPDVQAGAERCDATVGEFERCANDIVAELDVVLSSVACSDLADAEALQTMPRDPGPSFKQPPACADLEAQCPSFDIARVGQ